MTCDSTRWRRKHSDSHTGMTVPLRAPNGPKVAPAHRSRNPESHGKHGPDPVTRPARRVGAEGGSPLRTGFAEADITPPIGTRKIGWLQEITIESIRDPLFARIAVFESDGERAAFVQLDLLSIRWTQVNDIRRRVKAQFGFPGDRVLVCATHNHAGPAVAGLEPLPRDEPYIEAMVRKVVAAFGQALAGSAEAEIGFGHGPNGNSRATAGSSCATGRSRRTSRPSRRRSSAAKGRLTRKSPSPPCEAAPAACSAAWCVSPATPRTRAGRRAPPPAIPAPWRRR